MENLSEKVEFKVPTREQVSESHQAIFDNMVNKYGMVPNLYAVFAWNDTALADYLALQGRKSTLSLKEREIINLIVSEINDCDYCRRSHSAVAKMGNLFSDEELLEVRRANISFNDKLQALAKFVKEVAINRGRASYEAVSGLFEAGYNKANLVDIVINIGDKTISNYLHNLTHVAIEFPEVPHVGALSGKL
jgi:uncharacterized peroxidase-related enzyme